MSEIPQEWLLVTLEDVANIVTGTTPPTKNIENYGGNTPFVKPGDLDTLNPITTTKQTLSEIGLKQARLLRSGAILVSCIGNLGKVGIAGVPLVTNQQINAIEFEISLVNDRYGYHYCKTLKKWMEEEASATTVTILNKGRFSKAPFVIPPLNEQKRIADKLDRILARVDACREKCDRIPPILKRFRQSVLAAATSGELTEDWREDHKLSYAEWSAYSIGELLSDVRYGTAKKSSYDGNGDVPVIRIPNIQSGRVDTHDLKYGQFDEREIKTLALRAGDILIIRSNGSLELVGKTAVVESEIEGYLFAGYLIRLRVKIELITPKYLYFFLSSPKTRQIIELTAKSTSGVNNINSKEVQSIEINLPPIEEQKEIVRRVELLFAYADRLETYYQKARAHCDRLTPAILDKAFRGDLVPQDPNDEPASALLERIQTQRAAAAKPKRTTKQHK